MANPDNVGITSDEADGILNLLAVNLRASPDHRAAPRFALPRSPPVPSIRQRTTPLAKIATANSQSRPDWRRHKRRESAREPGRMPAASPPAARSRASFLLL